MPYLLLLGCMHAYSLPIHCAETVRNFGALHWAVGTHAGIHSQEGERKTSHNMHFPYNPIDFASISFGYCPQFTHPARAPMKQS